MTESAGGMPRDTKPAPSLPRLEPSPANASGDGRGSNPMTAVPRHDAPVALAQPA